MNQFMTKQQQVICPPRFCWEKTNVPITRVPQDLTVILSCAIHTHAHAQASL